MLKEFFSLLCKYKIFHDYQANEQGIEICSFCGKKRTYDSTGGWMP